MVVTAADGPAALDAIETHRPALVVLDLMLPEWTVGPSSGPSAATTRRPPRRSSSCPRGDDDRPDRRSRGRRRRLPAEAVLAGRARPSRQVDPGRATPATASPATPHRPPRSPPKPTIRHGDLSSTPIATRSAGRPADRPDPGRVPPAERSSPRTAASFARPAPGCGLRPRRRRGPGPDHRRPRRPVARQARRRRRAAALRRNGPRRRLPGRAPRSGPPKGRGIAVRIALAALAFAAVGLEILAVGVAVVGADFTR